MRASENPWMKEEEEAKEEKDTERAEKEGVRVRKTKLMRCVRERNRKSERI